MKIIKTKYDFPDINTQIMVKQYQNNEILS